jgi:hypothetical protein
MQIKVHSQNVFKKKNISNGLKKNYLILTFLKKKIPFFFKILSNQFLLHNTNLSTLIKKLGNYLQHLTFKYSILIQ